MKALLLKGWDFMRILRLATGLTGIVFGFKNQDLLLGFAGFFLLLMAAFNIGCCGFGGCSISSADDQSRLGDKEKKNVHYEEVV